MLYNYTHTHARARMHFRYLFDRIGINKKPRK